jgi:hypothetical protein
VRTLLKSGAMSLLRPASTARRIWTLQHFSFPTRCLITENLTRAISAPNAIVQVHDTTEEIVRQSSVIITGVPTKDYRLAPRILVVVLLGFQLSPGPRIQAADGLDPPRNGRHQCVALQKCRRGVPAQGDALQHLASPVQSEAAGCQCLLLLGVSLSLWCVSA